MAAPYTSISPQELEQYAYKYIRECLNNTSEQVSHSKGIVRVKDRHIPTVEFFLRIWLPEKLNKTINRSTYYDWLNLEPKEGHKKYEEHRLKSNAIKKIDELFKSLAIDIVANEGKGIFYAKNRLGMTDKQEYLHKEQPLFKD